MRKKKLLAMALACAMIAQSSVGVLADTTNSNVGESDTLETTNTEVGEESGTDSDVTVSEEKVTEDGYRYVIKQYEGCEAFANITGYDGDKTNLLIPEEIGEYRVYGVGDYAFANNTSITSVECGERIESIGAAAFYNCTSLIYANLQGVRDIGTDTDTDGAFGNCTNLKSVYIGYNSYDGEIGNYAFYNTGLETVEIPWGFVRVGEYAFAKCNSLKRVEYHIDESFFGDYQDIGKGAFSNCPNLVAAGFTDRIRLIDSTAFENSNSVKMYAADGSEIVNSPYTFALENNIPFVKDYEGVTEEGFVYREKYGRIEITGYEGEATDITIPATIDGLDVVIGYAAFYGKPLTSVKISEGISVIDQIAFMSCEEINEIEFPSTITMIGQSSFEFADGLEKIIFKEGNMPAKIDDFAFSSDKLKSVEIPGNYVFIGSEAFSSSSLEELVWKDSNINVGNVLDGWSLSLCTNLKKVSLPKTLVNIENAFGNCAGIEHIVIPEGVVRIAGEEFIGFSSLQTITILSDKTIIGDNLVANPSNVVIYAKKGSKAETYAKENGYIFCELGGELKVTGTANLQKVSIGEKLNIRAVAEGGEGPYTYSYIVYNKTTNSWFRLADNITSSKFSWTSTGAGERIFYVDVKDATGKVVRCNGLETVTVEGDVHVKAEATVDMTTSLVGEVVTFTAGATGGDGNYTYSLIVYNETTDSWFRLADNVSTNTFKWAAGSTGTRYFYIDVKDGNGKVSRAPVMKIKTIEIDVSAYASEDSVSVGDTVNIYGYTYDGEEPCTYSFVVYNHATNAWFRHGFSESDTLEWKATSAGKRTFYVEVKDKNGKVVRAEGVTVDVQ